MEKIERVILKTLLSNEKFAQATVSHIKDEYFSSAEGAWIFRHFLAFYEKFRKLPNVKVIELDLEDDTTLSTREVQSVNDAINDVWNEPSLNDDQYEWLIQATEKYCQERALYVALRKSVAMLDDTKASPHAIPELLKEALAVSFDMSVGHDVLGDAESRYEFYHRAESRIPFDLEVFNTVTKGGIPTKTLNVVLAGTNVGKSLFLVHMAAACLRMNKNVLYITLEMAEERIAERLDANMMDIPMDDIPALTRAQYLRKINAMRLSSTGRVIVKEYPTGAAHAGHFRALLQELRSKQHFVPDIVFIDYLSICASSRVKMGASVNSYTYNKSIAEELRGLGVEYNIPIFTAAQFNRDGSASTDPGLDKISESFAIAQTADFIVALTTSEDLEKNNQIQVYTLKNRYGKRQSYQKFILGVDTSRMKLYDTQSTTVSSVVPPPLDPFAMSTKPMFNFGGNRRRPSLSHLKTSDEWENS